MYSLTSIPGLSGAEEFIPQFALLFRSGHPPRLALDSSLGTKDRIET